MMKVKYIATALVSDDYLKITKGKKYPVLSRELNSICIYDDCGVVFWMDMDKFSISETPPIEVGSEWLWEEANETLVVKCVGDTSVFYQWISDGSEGCEEIDDFLKSFKQKPKTVTMYFHKNKTGEYYAQETKCAGYLFTKEIEL